MISVIVPVYNGSAYIERCINSITGSTFRDIEIIAVENGSTDNTWEILEALAAGDSRIKPYLHGDTRAVQRAEYRH